MTIDVRGTLDQGRGRDASTSESAPSHNSAMEAPVMVDDQSSVGHSACTANTEQRDTVGTAHRDVVTCLFCNHKITLPTYVDRSVAIRAMWGDIKHHALTCKAHPLALRWEALKAGVDEIHDHWASFHSVAPAAVLNVINLISQLEKPEPLPAPPTPEEPRS